MISSNIDFNFLRGILSFETRETRYSFFMGIGNESTAKVQKWNAEVDQSRLPGGLKLQLPAPPPAVSQMGASGYTVISPPKSSHHAEASKALDDLHRYYDANRDRLVREYEESETARIAREKWNREHPPVPQDTTINFFPIRSGQN